MSCYGVLVQLVFLRLKQEILKIVTNLITPRALFSPIPIEFGQTGISAIRFADPENPVLEPNTE